MRAVICCSFIALITFLAQLQGCFEAGANFHQQAPGNNDRGGVSLDEGGFSTAEERDNYINFQEIAIDPRGRYFLSASHGRLIHGDLQNGSVELVAGVEKPARVAFAYLASRYYVVSKATRSLVAVNPTQKKILWQTPLPMGQSHLATLYVSKDDQRVAILDGGILELRDAPTGSLILQLSVGSIHDIDFTPDSKELLVTKETVWNGTDPTTSIMVLNAVTGDQTHNIKVPNCSSHLVLTPDGTRGFLAPEDCSAPTVSKDPVSIIDLKQKKWLQNLPGFGPVAMAPDGVTAVAFMDANNLDLDLFLDLGTPPSADEARYHLMLINTQTLKFYSLPLGDTLPRYTITPDGQVVLIDFSAWWSTTEDRIRILDVPARTLHEVTGPKVSLDYYVMSTDSKEVYLLDASVLYRLSIDTREVTDLEMPEIYASMNITPDGTQLLLLDYQDTLHVYDLARQSIVRKMSPPVAP